MRRVPIVGGAGVDMQGDGERGCRYCATRPRRAGRYRFFEISFCIRWVVETLNATVDSEIDALPRDMRARLARLAEMIERFGFEGLPRDSTKHLDGKLWELRIPGRDGISRAIYLIAPGVVSSSCASSSRRRKRRRLASCGSPASARRR
jgi:hypothetical protein